MHIWAVYEFMNGACKHKTNQKVAAKTVKDDRKDYGIFPFLDP